MNRRKFLKSTALMTTGISSSSLLAASTLKQQSVKGKNWKWDTACPNTVKNTWLRVCRRSINNASYPYRSSYPWKKVSCPNFEFQNWVDNWEDSTVEACLTLYNASVHTWHFSFRNHTCGLILLAAYKLKTVGNDGEEKLTVEASELLADVLTATDFIDGITRDFQKKL